MGNDNTDFHDDKALPQERRQGQGNSPRRSNVYAETERCIEVRHKRDKYDQENIRYII